MTINHPNQMTQRYQGEWSDGPVGELRYLYYYDANGSLIESYEYEKQAPDHWIQVSNWVYTWNVRDQLTLAMKWDEGLADNSGSVAYEYCLTCDSAMSRRFVYAGGSGSTQGEISQAQRFVYDGLTLLRAAQLYDSDEDEALEMTDGWRVWWENTTMSALLGGLLAKRVYAYPNDQSGTSNGHTDYYYAHDAVGNVVAVSDGAGARQHHFTQDAFGNELALDSLGGDDWDDAHEAGIWEHQTGKWFDLETGLYFFHARWVDPVVGRCVSATTLPRHVEGAYVYCENNSVTLYDPTGRLSISYDDYEQPQCEVEEVDNVLEPLLFPTAFSVCYRKCGGLVKSKCFRDCIGEKMGWNPQPIILPTPQPTFSPFPKPFPTPSPVPPRNGGGGGKSGGGLGFFPRGGGTFGYPIFCVPLWWDTIYPPFLRRGCGANMT